MRIISHVADFYSGHQEMNLVSSPNTSSVNLFCFDIPVCFLKIELHLTSCLQILVLMIITHICNIITELFLKCKRIMHGR